MDWRSPQNTNPLNVFKLHYDDRVIVPAITRSNLLYRPLYDDSLDRLFKLSKTPNQGNHFKYNFMSLCPNWKQRLF